MFPRCSPRTNSKKTQACQIHAKALDEVTQHLYLAEVPTRSPKTRARTEKGDGHDALCPVHKSRPVDGFENLPTSAVCKKNRTDLMQKFSGQCQKASQPETQVLNRFVPQVFSHVQVHFKGHLRSKWKNCRTLSLDVLHFCTQRNF